MSNSAYSVWDAVERLLREGKAPRVTLTKNAEVKPPPRRHGRPRVRDQENPFLHYATPRKGYTRARCMICRSRLRKVQVEVCSEDCKEKAEAWLENKMARLQGRGVRIPLTKSAVEFLKRADKLI